MTGLLVAGTVLLITFALIGGSVLILADGGYPGPGVVTVVGAGVLGYALIRLIVGAPRRRAVVHEPQALPVRGAVRAVPPAVSPRSPGVQPPKGPAAPQQTT